MSGEQPIAFPDLPRSKLEQAIQELVGKANDVLETQGRLRSLLAATRAIAEELQLAVVLERLVRVAVDLVGARYGALAVIGSDGGLEQFIHVGMSAEQVHAIGSLPIGRGILAAMTHEHRAVRLEHVTEDPRSVGFPPNHPWMDSFVGVPIRVRGEVYGNLILTDRSDGPFSAEDEELLTALAAGAGVAIDKARLFGETERRQRWAVATAELTAALLNDEGADPLRLVAQTMIDLTGAEVVLLLSQTTAGAIVTEAAWGGEDADDFAGRVLPLAESLSGQVIASGNPQLSLGIKFVDRAGEERYTGPAMIVPLDPDDGDHAALGAIRPAGAARFVDADLDMAADFAGHVSVALQLREARRVRERIALLEDRNRIARDLHDNVIQRLFAAGLSLNGLDHEALPRPTRERIDVVSDLLDQAIVEIRKSVFALRSAASVQGGARRRLLDVMSESAAAFPTAPRIVFEGALDDLASTELVEDLEAVLREGMSNAARHSQATSVSVIVAADDSTISVLIIDDGTGPNGQVRSSGISNLRARADGWGGESELRPGDDGGSVLEWRVPTPLRRERTT